MSEKIEISGVTHISLPVRDIEESEKFYTEFLGLELRGRLGRPGTKPEMVCVGVGDHDILLCLAGEDELRPRDQRTRVHHSLTVSPPEWEKAVRLLCEYDVELSGPIVYRSGAYFNGREVYFFDPSGNRLEIRDPSWVPGMPEPTFEEINGIPARA
jgi:catechol 2,3-dioxygenase-like lactoylglutathione lyase family enzyme